jgi:K+-transporting ATPase ATPase C chain
MNTTRDTGDLRPALVLLLLLTVLTGVIYPLGITLAGGLLFPGAAHGSLIERDGRVVGSHWIGQDWQGPEWFQGRPSATGERPYNPLPSSGSNLGPLNPDLAALFTERAAALREAHPGAEGPLPVDLLTASSSGLDPHITPAAARLQAARVAAARGMSVASVDALVERATEPPQFGFLGEARVNVLRLNLSLDSLAKVGAP